MADLQGGAVEVHAAPAEGGRYTKVREYRRRDELRSGTVPDLALPVAELLG